jgi:hypothetical protein
MKVGGKSALVKNSKSLTLKSGDEKIDLVLTAVPMGWRDKILKTKAFVFPEAPKKPLKDNKGKVIRREDGTAEIFQDEEDQEYKEGMADVGARFRAVKVYQILKEDSNILFDSQEPVSLNTDEWLKFSKSILEELAQFGLTEAEIISIDYLGDKLSVRVDMDQVKTDFLSGESQDSQE